MHHVCATMEREYYSVQDMASRFTSTMQEARTCFIYVYIHGQLDVVSIYGSAKVACLRTESVPVEPNKIRTRIEASSARTLREGN